MVLCKSQLPFSGSEREQFCFMGMILEHVACVSFGSWEGGGRFLRMIKMNTLIDGITGVGEEDKVRMLDHIKLDFKWAHMTHLVWPLL